ncbi:MAG: hypothetical protein QM617_09175 [Comamonas sp.]
MASKTETITATPRLGEQITVKVAEGAVLINNETGQPFAAGQATPQTVTVTLLRRLADGDLVLA